MCFILFDSTKSRKQLIKQNGQENMFLIFIFNSATILKARTDDYVLLQNLKMRKQHIRAHSTFQADLVETWITNGLSM